LLILISLAYLLKLNSL
jgi:hypothetical protein